jgi:hypothetical protein
LLWVSLRDNGPLAGLWKWNLIYHKHGNFLNSWEAVSLKRLSGAVLQERSLVSQQERCNNRHIRTDIFLLHMCPEVAKRVWVL